MHVHVCVGGCIVTLCTPSSFTHLMLTGPIIGIATLFGLLSVITSTSTLCLFVCVAHLFKKNRSDKGTLCAYTHCMYFRNVCV